MSGPYACRNTGIEFFGQQLRLTLKLPPPFEEEQETKNKKTTTLRDMQKIKIVPILLVAVVFCHSCKIAKVTYNMTGGSLSPDVKTFSVDYFPNKAPLVVPYLSSMFTEKLTDYIRQKTRLSQLTDNDGDIRFEGQITKYYSRPIDIKKDEVAASNRLTIEVRVKYTNTKSEDEDYDFDSTFSNYADYSTETDLNSVEESLIEEILEKIIEDIYNKAIVNW